MLTLPSLTVDCSDRFLLVKQQTEDPYLGTVRQLAEKQERGYRFLDGVIVHCDKSDLDAPIRHIVLPMERRATAMKLAHDSDLAGHCGVKRTLKKLFPCVTWPNINWDVTKFVCECCPCQKQAMSNRNRAPLHPLPIIGTPFRRIAFDLVGPYPHTTRGFKYFLTCICYLAGILRPYHYVR